MTKQEALAAMRNGSAITHKRFTSDEYIYIDVNTRQMYDEGGYELPYKEFWDYRASCEWDNDWSIYKEK